MLKDLLKIKKINKNMKKFVDNQIYFFENILKEMSNKKYIKKINNKYMGVSFSYGIITLNNNYISDSENTNNNNIVSNISNINKGYKLIKNDILDEEINKIKKNKKYNNINE